MPAVLMLACATPAMSQSPAFDERPPPPTEPSIPVPAGKTPSPAAKPPARRHIAVPPRKPLAGVRLPPPETLVTMIRGALVAVNQANFTDNYSVVHALGTHELQERSSPADLARAFKRLRDLKLDLSPVLLLPVEFTKPPAVAADGRLDLVGRFPTRPQQIEFAIVYYPVAGHWRIDGLSVSTSPVAPAPVAQTTPPPGPAAKPSGGEPKTSAIEPAKADAPKDTPAAKGIAAKSPKDKVQP